MTATDTLGLKGYETRSTSREDAVTWTSGINELEVTPNGMYVRRDGETNHFIALCDLERAVELGLALRALRDLKEATAELQSAADSHFECAGASCWCRAPAKHIRHVTGAPA